MREHFKKFDWEISANSKISQYSITDSLRRVITIVERKVGDTTTINVKVMVSRKRFLKQNKARILDLDFICRYSPEFLFFKYLGGVRGGVSTKVFFVIDKESLKRKDKLLTMRKATIVNFGYSGL